MRNRNTTTIVIVLLLALGCAPQGTPDGEAGSAGEAAEAPSIEGVWAFASETNTETGELIRDDSTWKGIWVFTEGYHCLARMQMDRPAASRSELEEMTPEEQLEILKEQRNYSSTAGTYTTEGDTLRRQWEISLGPGIIGMESVATYRIEDGGDTLVVDLPRRSEESGPAVRVVYRRLE